MFHLADLVGLSEDLDRVVELNFIPLASVLRELSMIGPNATVAVVAPTPRGIERMRALVGQYYAGAINAVDVHDPASIEGVDVIVQPVAMDLAPYDFSGVRQTIVIDWELDPVSAATFAGRVAAAAER
jgi:hypothetical protein